MQTRPIFPDSEQTFLVMEATPYTGYEVAFTGTAAECLSWCKEHRRGSVNELYKLFEIEADLLVIIISLTLLNAGRIGHIEKLCRPPIT